MKYARLIIGLTLLGLGGAHLWFHGQWGNEDWAVTGMMMFGAFFPFVEPGTLLDKILKRGRDDK